MCIRTDCNDPNNFKTNKSSLNNVPGLLCWNSFNALFKIEYTQTLFDRKRKQIQKSYNLKKHTQRVTRDAKRCAMRIRNMEIKHNI